MPKKRTTALFLVRRGKVINLSPAAKTKKQMRKRPTLAEALTLVRGDALTPRDDVVNLKFYPGFANIPDALCALQRKNIDEDSFLIIRFNKQHYAVGYDGPNKVIIIGSDRVWYKSKGYFVNCNLNDFSMPYPVSRNRMEVKSSMLSRELEQQDSDLAVYELKKGKVCASDIEKARCHLAVLAASFHHEFYTKEGIATLKEYFSTREMEGFAALFEYKIPLNDAQVTGINPFKCYARVTLNERIIMAKIRAKLIPAPWGRKFAGYELEPFWLNLANPT